MKHHYVPEFYLKSWASGSQSRLPYYTWVNDKLFQSYISPGGTGYKKDLYAVPNADGSLSHEVETKFFAVVDDKASVAFQSILNGKSINLEQRVNVAQFLMTMRLRDPETVTSMVEHHRRQMTDLSDEWEEYYRELFPDRNTTLSQELDALGDQYFHRSAHSILANTSRGKAAQLMCEMTWVVHDTSHCQHSLLTCDNPVWVTDMRQPNGSFAMALSPSKILVGSYHAASAHDLKRTLPKLVRDYNRRVARGAIKFIYASNVEEWHKPFLHKHFPKEGFTPPIAAMIPDYKIDLPLSALDEE